MREQKINSHVNQSSIGHAAFAKTPSLASVEARICCQGNMWNSISRFVARLSFLLDNSRMMPPPRRRIINKDVILVVQFFINLFWLLNIPDFRRLRSPNNNLQTEVTTSSRDEIWFSSTTTAAQRGNDIPENHDHSRRVWKDFDDLRRRRQTTDSSSSATSSSTLPLLGARLQRSRVPPTRPDSAQSLTSVSIANRPPASGPYRVVLIDGPLGNPKTDICPWQVRNETNDKPASSSSATMLSPGDLPGYTGWYRAVPSPIRDWYRPVYVGGRSSSAAVSNNGMSILDRRTYTIPMSREGRIQYRSYEADEQSTTHYHRIALDTTSSGAIPWTIVLLCPFVECQGGGETRQAVESQFYARAYGPAIVTGHISVATVEMYHPSVRGRNETEIGQLQQSFVGYEVSFYFRYPGIYTVEIVLEQGSSWSLFKYPRTFKEWKDPDPIYEGWMLPSFPWKLEVIANQSHSLTAMMGDSSPPPPNSKWCSMEELEESHPSDQWKVTATSRNPVASHPLPAIGSFQNYQLGYATLGICLDFKKANCSILPTRRLLLAAGKTKEDNILAQCLQHGNTTTEISTQPGTTTSSKINIILIGDSVIRYNAQRLTEILKIDVEPASPAYITFLGEFHTGVQYALPTLERKLREVASREDERRVVIFNFGLHDIKDTCVDHPVELMNQQATGIVRTSGDCVEFYRTGFNRFLDFIEGYSAELKIFRTTNAGWMRWGQFGFSWPANDQQLGIYSHHSVKQLNDVAIDAIKRRGGNSTVKILDFFPVAISRPDNTDVDAVERHSTGSHLVHPGVDTTRLLVRLEVMMILRHFCSDFLDSIIFA